MMKDKLIGVALIVAVIAMVAMKVAFEEAREADRIARDYCAEHGAIAVGQYCLTEAELVLRRVPERF